MVVVIILAFNSRSVIERTILAAQRVSRTIVVVDSGSEDDTVQIAEGLGCKILVRAFENYADQRNWAIREVGSAYQWQLHLDADEVLDDLAVQEINGVLSDPGNRTSFMIQRCTYFLGARLRFGGTMTWHLRLFQSGSVVCEDRLYDQHFVAKDQPHRLRGLLHDQNVGNLSEWINRHNRWSDLEATEVLQSVAAAKHRQIEARLSNDPRERKRYYKSAYYKAPLFFRAIAYFLFRYLIQLGILDGRPGFLYAFFQALWFRMLVDAKIFEKREP